MHKVAILVRSFNLFNWLKYLNIRKKCMWHTVCASRFSYTSLQKNLCSGTCLSELRLKCTQQRTYRRSSCNVLVNSARFHQNWKSSINFNNYFRCQLSQKFVSLFWHYDRRLGNRRWRYQNGEANSTFIQFFATKMSKIGPEWKIRVLTHNKFKQREYSIKNDFWFCNVSNFAKQDSICTNTTGYGSRCSV
jgi:hypothetical protein